MNPNYAMIVKQDLNKLLIIGFIKLVETSHMVVVNYGCVKKMTNYAYALISTI
jgi:hypothetical protein